MPISSIFSISPQPIPSNFFSPRLLFLSILLTQLCSPVVSSSCYYDINGRTTCDGLSYGARLAIAAAVTIVGALALTGVSYVVRKRFYRSNGPPPVSAGYYGPPPQTSYPPNVAYAHPYAQPYPQQPNGFGAPPYAPPAGPPPPGYNPYAQKDESHPVPHQN